MDREHDQAEGSAERTHTPEEQAAFQEQVSEMVGYVNLLEAHDQALGEEMYAERERAEATATTDLDRMRAADRVEERWHVIRQPAWWAIGVLLIAIVLTVIAFYDGASDTASSTGDAGDVDVSATGEQAADDGASDEGAAEDASDEGGAADAGGAATSGGDDPVAAQDTADAEYLLDLAREVVAHAGAANAAIGAGEKGEASEHLMAVKPLMTQYIEGGGDLLMHDFSEAQDVWLRAANSYVGGNTGAFSDMQAAYDEMVAALEHYEVEAASD